MSDAFAFPTRGGPGDPAAAAAAAAAGAGAAPAAHSAQTMSGDSPDSGHSGASPGVAASADHHHLAACEQRHQAPPARDVDAGGSDLILPYDSISWDRTPAGERVELGVGAISKVYRAVLFGGTPVAVKEIQMDDVTSEIRGEFIAHVAVLRKLRHSNVLLVLGVCEEPLCFITSFMAHGSLHDCMNRETLSPARKASILVDVVRGMAYIHAMRVLHSDLKPQRILLDEHYRAKVAGCWISHVMTEKPEMVTSQRQSVIDVTGFTPPYAAPEVLKTKSAGLASDVYSFAVLVGFVHTEKAPWLVIPYHEFAPHVIDGDRPYKRSQFPSQYSGLIERCWCPEPERRLTFGSILPILQGLGELGPQ